MPRPRPQPARCSCMNNADAPSTHRGANHSDKNCPHSTLHLTTGGYAEQAAAAKAKRGMRGRTTPKRSVPIIVLED